MISTWSPWCRRPSLRSSRATCALSSRVGQTTSACSDRRARSIPCKIGNANATVLPLPVLDWPIRSLPASSAGMLSVWIGVGAS